MYDSEQEYTIRVESVMLCETICAWLCIDVYIDYMHHKILKLANTVSLSLTF